MLFRIGRNLRRATSIPVVFALFLFISLGAASAQTWVGGTGNQWFTGSNWNPNTAPNSGSAAVSILNAANNPVILNSGAAVSTLTLGASNSLNITSGQLSIGGSVSNSGTVNANSNSAVFSLSGTASSTNTGLLEATGGGTLSLASTIINTAGNITATGAGSAVNVSATIQGGTLNTSNGGVIVSSGASLDGESSGAITLSDGSVFTDVSSADTQFQGTLKLGTVTGSTFTLSGSLGLTDDATLSGPGSLIMTGGQIGKGGRGAPTLTNQSTIQGWGTIGGADQFGHLAVTNNGTINANVSGQPLIVSATASFTNTGLLEATGGGTLSLVSTSTINNAGGNITATGAGSTVNVSTTIQGGTLNTSNGGVMQTDPSGSATLDGITNGAITISDGSTYKTGQNQVTFITGTLNLGTVTGSTFALSSGATLQLTGSTTLSGPGALTMDGASASISSVTLTNQATIQGSGSISTFQALITNTGTINATQTVNGAGMTFNLVRTEFDNTGLLEATGGGNLDFEASGGSVLPSGIVNSGGNITATGAGSTVTLGQQTAAGGYISGGTLNTSNGGRIISYGALLDGESNGAITLSDGSVFTDVSSAHTQLQGTLTLGTVTGSTFTLSGSLGLTDNATLSGPGSLIMSGGQIGTNTRSPSTLTNQSTIQGWGSIGGADESGNLTVINNGTIAGNVSGKILVVAATGGLTNAGLLEASNGAALQVTSTLSDFSLGTLTGNYKVDGSGGNKSSLQISSFGSAGGEVTTLGDGTTASSITLNGTNANTIFTDAAGKNALALGTITANASLTLEGGYNLSTPGALSSAGSVTIGGGSELNANGAYTQTAGSTRIESGGTLSATAFNLQGGTAQVDGTIDPPSSPSLIDLGAELFGTGDIVGNVISSGELFPGDDPTPGTFTIDGNYEETSTGSLMEAIGGTEGAPIAGLLHVIGNVQLDAGATLDVEAPAFTPGFPQTLEILSYTGTLSGTFHLTGAGAGDFVVLYNSGEVDLEATPEPASFWLTLSFLGALLLLYGFRGRIKPQKRLQTVESKSRLCAGSRWEQNVL